MPAADAFQLTKMVNEIVVTEVSTSSASEGINSGSTFVDDSSVGTQSWSNPGNAAASDNSRSSVSLSTGQVSHYLKATGFGFNIPSNAIIVGIEFKIERLGGLLTNGEHVEDNSIKLVKGGTISGDEKATKITWNESGFSDRIDTFGGSSDLWGLTWTFEDINASDFGGVCSAKLVGTGTRTAKIDHMTLKVFYTTKITGGIILPTGVKGMFIKIKNNSLEDTRVFPTLGGRIDDLAVDDFFILPPDNAEVFNCFETNEWFSQSGGVFFVQKRIASADVKTLNTNKPDFVSAPGAGKAAILVGQPTVEVVFNTAAYTGNLALELIMKTLTEGLYENIDILGVTEDTHRIMSQQEATTTELQLLENKAIVVNVSGGDPATGDSPIIVRGHRKIVNVGLRIKQFSLDFNGTTQYLTVPDDDSLSFGDASTDSALTILAWINMDDATSFRIVDKSSAANNAEYTFYLSSADKFTFILNDATTSHRIGKQNAPVFTTDEGKWIFLVGTYNADGTSDGVKLYKDGVLLAAGNISLGNYTAMHNTTATVQIGANTWESKFANGKMSMVRIVNKELSAAEVLEAYNNGKVLLKDLLSFKENLISQWAMGDGATFTGGNWEIPDDVGSNDAESVNMIETNRIDDIPIG